MVGEGATASPPSPPPILLILLHTFIYDIIYNEDTWQVPFLNKLLMMTQMMIIEYLLCVYFCQRNFQQVSLYSINDDETMMIVEDA